RFDPPSLDEPRNIPIPERFPGLVRALHPYDKDEVDSNYMGFIIVMERIWARFLRADLEDFCCQQGPCVIRKEEVHSKVRKIMMRWMSKETVLREFPHDVKEPRDVAHVEYEFRVRGWHARQHIEEYESSTVLRLRELGRSKLCLDDGSPFRYISLVQLDQNQWEEQPSVRSFSITSTMPNSPIGTTGFPSDWSYYPTKAESSKIPPDPDPPEGLSKEQALAIRAELPGSFWNYSQRLYEDACETLKNEWNRLSVQKKTDWNENKVEEFLEGQLKKSIWAWEQVPYYGDNKPQLVQLEDEYRVRLRKEHVKLWRSDYEKNVIRWVKTYIQHQRLDQ
ncbi:MAG: hypothetical protein Q9169_006319, partial [Polycauliona sp. 2 TL-2023]